MLGAFYMNLQINEFRERGYVQFSNPGCLPEYEEALQSCHLDYRTVKGLGDYGVTIVLCKPEKQLLFVALLREEIARLETILRKKLEAL